MVSAAKLRRAQERALAARPYAQMLTNVLKSLVSRAEIYDPETGEAAASAAGSAPGKEHSADCGHRRQRSGRGVQHQYPEGGACVSSRPSRTRISKLKPSAARGAISCDAVIPAAEPRKAEARAGAIQIVGEHIGVLNKIELRHGSELAERVIERYTRRKRSTAVYLVFNEFKSVIAQRLVVEQVLPIEQIGEQEVRRPRSMTEKKKEQRPGSSKGRRRQRSLRRTRETMRSRKFGTAHVDYIYEQPPEELFPRSAAEVCGDPDLSRRCKSRWPRNTQRA